MDDTSLCPICGSKMRNLHMNNKFNYKLNKIYSYVERSCHNKKNHYVQIVADKETGKVDFIKFSLDPKYSKTLEINFYNNTCVLTLIRDKIPFIIDINKIIEPDFPHLTKLKQQVSLYSLFS